MKLVRLFLLLLCVPVPALATPAVAPCEWTHFTGSVRDDDGPLAHAKLAFVGEVWDSGCVATRRIGIETVADSEGHYDLKVRASSGALLFQHWNLDRYGGDRPVPVELRSGDLVVDYTFHSTRVRCLVTRPDGKPASGTFWFNDCEPGPGSFCSDLVSERQFEDGAFDAYSPDGGPLHVYTTLSDLPGEPRLARTFWVRSDTTVTIAYSGVTVRGELVSRGSPMSGVMVTATGDEGQAWAKTDSLGEFVVCIPAGSYRWTIQPNDGQPDFYEVERDVRASRPVHLQLEKAKKRR